MDVVTLKEMVSKELYYTIALSMVPRIGHIKAGQLIEHCGSAEEVFENQRDVLFKLSNQKKWGYSIEEILMLAKAELDFLHKNDVQAYTIQDDAYPERLKQCTDRPLLLYTKGQMNLNQKTVISIVGSRNATVKGKELCKQLVADLAAHNPLIISGLAYGIDVTAHQAALDNGLETIGVLGSGLKIIYPQKHNEIAKSMMKNGGIVSDYPSNTQLLPSQFAERNRIVAGLSDATIVVESTVKGGSMITAGLALDYNRDVYAIPGRPDDELSLGCNLLIKSNRAALIESAKDVEILLGLDQKKSKPKEIQAKLFHDLSEEELKISRELSTEKTKGIDEISVNAGLPMHKTSVLLLELEFKGIVRSLPGKMYQLV